MLYNLSKCGVVVVVAEPEGAVVILSINATFLVNACHNNNNVQNKKAKQVGITVLLN